MHPTTKPTILVVDDDPDIRKLLRMTLATETVTIVEASDGAEAVALAHLIHPTVVLLDLFLPGLDGNEVCARLRADPATADSHVIILSVAQAAEDPHTQGARCADEYVTKPFSPLALRQVIHHTLEVG